MFKTYKRQNIKYILVHMAAQTVGGIYYGFGAYMLLERGFSATNVGICISSASLITIILQISLSNLADRSDKINEFIIASVVSGIMSVMFFINFLLNEASIFLAIAIVLAGACYVTLEPFLASMAFSFKHKKIDVNFEVARAMGSFSYGVVCYVFGILSEIHSYRIITLFGLIFALGVLSSSLIIKKEYDSIDYKEEKEILESITFKEFFNNHKVFIFLCVCTVGIFIGYMVTENYMILVCENVGGTSGDMGKILGIKAFIEIGAMLLVSKLKNKINIKTLLKISVVAFIFKAYFLWAAKDVATLYIAQLFQFPGFGFLFPSMVEFVDSIMSPKESKRGQALFTMTLCIANLLVTYIAGFIIDNYGIGIAEYSAFIITTISAILFIFTVNKAK